MMNGNIYFDNAATSFPKAPGLGEAVAGFIDGYAVNVNRGAYAKAYKTAGIVYEARTLIADFFDCDDLPERYARRVIFTPGITYSINYFLRGFLKQGDNVIISHLEHHAVTRVLNDLADKGIDFKVVPVQKDGSVSISDFKNLIDEKTRAVLVTHASNICGAVLPIAKIGELCREKNIIFAVDTAQTAGSIKISMRKCNIDFLAFTGHKGMLGPQGIGGFIISERLDGKLSPTITGGTGSSSKSYTVPDFLPDKFESGTLNLPGIAGLVYSIKYINSVGISTIEDKEARLTKRFISGVKDLPNVKVIGYCEDVPHCAVVSLDFIGRDNAEIAFLLDNKYSIMTRTGLHCAPLAHEAFGTLNRGTVRFSFGYFNTEPEVDAAICAIKEIIK